MGPGGGQEVGPAIPLPAAEGPGPGRATGGTRRPGRPRQRSYDGPGRAAPWAVAARDGDIDAEGRPRYHFHQLVRLTAVTETTGRDADRQLTATG